MTAALLLAAALAAAPGASAPSPAPPRRVVHCSGTGAPSLRDAAGNVAVARVGAERAAWSDARRRCMEALAAAPLASGRTAGEVLAGAPALRARVERAVRRLVRRGATRLFADGGVRVDVELPLEGELAELLGGGGGH